MNKPWEIFDIAEDAPSSDNQSNMYCPDCRNAHMIHCSDPFNCGGMKPMMPWYGVSKASRPEGFVGVRKSLCDSPNLCFDRYGKFTQEEAEAWPVCGPCDYKVCEIIRLTK